MMILSIRSASHSREENFIQPASTCIFFPCSSSSSSSSSSLSLFYSLTHSLAGIDGQWLPSPDVLLACFLLLSLSVSVCGCIWVCICICFCMYVCMCLYMLQVQDIVPTLLSPSRLGSFSNLLVQREREKILIKYRNPLRKWHTFVCKKWSLHGAHFAPSSCDLCIGWVGMHLL